MLLKRRVDKTRQLLFPAWLLPLAVSIGLATRLCAQTRISLPVQSGVASVPGAQPIAALTAPLMPANFGMKRDFPLSSISLRVHGNPGPRIDRLNAACERRAEPAQRPIMAVSEQAAPEPAAAPTAAMPALETLAEEVRGKKTDPDAAILGSFYDRSGFQTAPGEPDPFAPLVRDPGTGLYGVSPDQLRAIVAILKKHYGSDLLDLAAIGSRAKGKASSLKNYRPPTSRSDLDLAPLLFDRRGGGPNTFAIEKEIESAVGFPVQLHGVLSTTETKFGDHVPFYGGGDETWEYFSLGEAVRIPIL